jgi:hypothetical protein
MSMPSLQGLKKTRPKIAGRTTNATKDIGDNEKSSKSMLFISCVLGCHIYHNVNNINNNLGFPGFGIFRDQIGGSARSQRLRRTPAS